LARRQASEQYFTSSQLRAQRRRQVMGRPQAAQGLLGRAALLPRNAGASGVIGNALPPGARQGLYVVCPRAQDGVYQIGDDQARSWIVCGTSLGNGSPSLTAS